MANSLTRPILSPRPCLLANPCLIEYRTRFRFTWRSRKLLLCQIRRAEPYARNHCWTDKGISEGINSFPSHILGAGCPRTGGNPKIACLSGLYPRFSSIAFTNIFLAFASPLRIIGFNEKRIWRSYARPSIFYYTYERKRGEILSMLRVCYK